MPQRLGFVLFTYALFGMMTLFFIGQSTLLLSSMIHAMAFLALGMFITTSAGETLFNKEETEILMHRPVLPKTLLWAKVWVLAQVSVYLSLSLNLVSFFVGPFTSDGSILFPFIHFVSIVEEALFAASVVVLLYQVCLKWFGREKLESLMTWVQVLATIGLVLGTQILPRVMFNPRFDTVSHRMDLHVDRPWWIYAIPSSWFAGLDDAVAGSHDRISWIFAFLGLAITALCLKSALGRLANSYESGIQTLNEAAATTTSTRKRLSLSKRVAETPPASWFLRDSVEKASFVLACGYIFRDRETRLRLYPGIVPMLIMPIAFAFTNHGMHDVPSRHAQRLFSSFTPFTAAISAGYFACLPLLALNLLTYTQQWKASEIFHIAPIKGPWPIQRGAQVAVMMILVGPMYAALAVFTALVSGVSMLPLIIPSALMLPLYCLAPALLAGSVPLSMPSEEAKAAGRGILIMIAMFLGIGIGVVSAAMWTAGLFWWFVGVEAAMVVLFSFLIQQHLRRVIWSAVD